MALKVLRGQVWSYIGNGNGKDRTTITLTRFEMGPDGWQRAIGVDAKGRERTVRLRILTLGQRGARLEAQAPGQPDPYADQPRARRAEGVAPDRVGLARPRGNLTPRALAALGELAAGKTVAEVAEEFNVGPTTVERWAQQQRREQRAAAP